MLVRDALVQKAARVCALNFTPDQIRALKAAEPRGMAGVMLGGNKPLALTHPKTHPNPRTNPKTRNKAGGEADGDEHRRDAGDN